MAFNIDVDELLEDFPHFLPVPTIAFERSIVQIVESCYRWQSDGVPFVVKGIPLDGRQSPFLATEDWLVRLTGSLDGRSIGGNSAGNNSVTTHTCPPEWSGWLHTSYLVPNCLLPHGLADLFSEDIDTTSCQLGVDGNVTRFEDGHHGTSGQYLLCFQEPDACVIWFTTAAADSQKVFDYLQSLQATSPHHLNLEQLSDVPFDVYVFKQERGHHCELLLVKDDDRGFATRSVLRSIQTTTTSLCLPAKYCVKRIAYDVMCSRFAELKISKTKPTLPTALEMRSLLEMVNEILRTEAYTNEEDIPSLGDLTITLSCAFCGGEIFQKVFRCKNKCLREGAIGFAPTNIISVCPSCYIDGRTCLCGKMAPSCLQPMAPMVTSRDKVAAWLRSSGKDLLLSDDSEDNRATDRRGIAEQLDSGGLADRTFLAALFLCLARDDSTRAKRTCTIRNGQPSHQVDGYAALNCQNCHASKCYQHILSTLNIHSSQAVLVYYTTESPSEAWHKHHIDLKHDYLESYPTLLSNMLSGSYHPLNHRLVYFSHNFSTMGPVSKNTARGFYDVDETASDVPLGSRGKGKKNSGPSTALKRSADAGSTRDAVGSAHSVDQESSTSKEPSSTSNGSDADESARSESPQSSEAERQPTRKRGRRVTSESEGEADTVRSKRPRVGRRVEENRENRPLFQREDHISFVSSTKKPSSGKEKRRPGSRRISQILSSSPGPESNEPDHSPAKALKSFDPEIDLEIPKSQTISSSKLVSGWETLISSFGLPASNPHVIPRLGNLKPQEVSDPKKDRRITREPQEGRRKSDLAATFLRPSEEVDRTVRRNRSLAEISTKSSWSLQPKPQDSGPSRAGGSSQHVPNLPRSASFSSQSGHVLGRGLRKQRSEMALSDDSVSRENLLFYLDCMQAPDEEADEDLRGTYASKRS